MGYYHNKEKYDPEHAGNRKEGSLKTINDPFYGTGDADANRPVTDLVPPPPDPTVPKTYDASKNAGGPHAATEKPER